MRGDVKVDYLFQTFENIHELAKMRGGVVGKLCTFLSDVYKNGIPETQTKSISELPLLICKSEKRPDQITSIAAEANARGNGRQQHDVLQSYFLDNDRFTIATETPVWRDGVLGHIDLIRIADDVVEVWDYKPDAHRETKAASQILRYRNFLAKCTGIPLSNIQAGYFDEKNAYFLKF